MKYQKPGKLSDSKLKAYHWWLHSRYSREDVSRKEVIGKHVEAVRVMEARGLKHSRRDKLDRATADDFERSIEEGGPGSGHSDHAGRPGQHGGSLPGIGSVVNAGELVALHMRRDIKDPWDDGPRVKDDICTNLARDSGMSYEEANAFTKQWAVTSNDEDMKSLSIQRDAAREFGASLSDWQKASIDTADGKPMFGSVTQQSALRAMYDNTQKALAAEGIGAKDTVLVYRGFASSSPVEGGTYTGNCLESWSVNRRVAKDFGKATYRTGEYRYVISARVPRSMIVSTCRTGFGCLIEDELVILGNTLQGVEATRI